MQSIDPRRGNNPEDKSALGVLDDPRPRRRRQNLRWIKNNQGLHRHNIEEDDMPDDLANTSTVGASKTPSIAGPAQSSSSGPVIDERFLRYARLPFTVSLTAVFGIIVLVLFQSLSGHFRPDYKVF